MHQTLSIWSVKKICHKCFTLTLTGALVLLYIQQQQHHVVINYINSVMICISIRKLIFNASSSSSSPEAVLRKQKSSPIRVLCTTRRGTRQGRGFGHPAASIQVPCPKDGSFTRIEEESSSLILAIHHSRKMDVDPVSQTSSNIAPYCVQRISLHGG